MGTEPDQARRWMLLAQAEEFRGRGHVLMGAGARKYHHDPGEVWVGDDPAMAEWGRKLAALKDKKTLPLYDSPRGRIWYEFRDQPLITGDAEEPQEPAKLRSPAALSRSVFIKPVARRTFQCAGPGDCGV